MAPDPKFKSKLNIGLSTGVSGSKGDQEIFGEGGFTKGSVRGNTSLYTNSGRRGKTNLSINATAGGSYSKKASATTTDFEKDLNTMDQARFNNNYMSTSTQVTDKYKKNMNSLRGGKFKGDESNLNIGANFSLSKTKRSGGKTKLFGGGGFNVKTIGAHIGKKGSANISDAINTYSNPSPSGNSGAVTEIGREDSGASNWGNVKKKTTTKPYIQGGASTSFPTGRYKSSGEITVSGKYGSSNAPEPGFTGVASYKKGKWSGNVKYNTKSNSGSIGVGFTLGGNKKKR